MSKTLSIKAFTYDELDQKAQETARDWFRERDNFDPDHVYEDVKMIAPLMGITLRELDRGAAIYWSGFSSQGDGACFEGSWVASDVQPGKVKDHAPQDKELHRIAEEFERMAKLYPEANFSVKHSGQYSHKFCTGFDVTITDDEIVGEDEWREAENVLIEAARDFMDWIYQQLEDAYNFEQQDDTVAENIRANEYLFTAQGKRSVAL